MDVNDDDVNDFESSSSSSSSEKGGGGGGGGGGGLGGGKGGQVKLVSGPSSLEYDAWPEYYLVKRHDKLGDGWIIV